MGARLLALGALVVAPSAGAAVACGPSFQAVYEGNAHFEHCYALEENAQRPMPEKAACWKDWSDHYTFGQTRDRINYAAARYSALTANVPTDEAMMMAAPGETPRQTTITAPAPTNAFAPPPKVLEGPRLPAAQQSAVELPMIAADAGSEPVASAPLPSASCADGCGTQFRTCGGPACEVDGGSAGGSTGAKSKSCGACQRTYRTCMRDCFR